MQLALLFQLPIPLLQSLLNGAFKLLTCLTLSDMLLEFYHAFRNIIIQFVFHPVIL